MYSYPNSLVSRQNKNQQGHPFAEMHDWLADRIWLAITIRKIRHVEDTTFKSSTQSKRRSPEDIWPLTNGCVAPLQNHDSLRCCLVVRFQQPKFSLVSIRFLYLSVSSSWIYGHSANVATELFYTGSVLMVLLIVWHPL